MKEKLEKNEGKFHTHKIKDASRISMLLKVLSQLNGNHSKEDLRITYNIEIELLKEIVTRFTTPDNAL